MADGLDEEAMAMCQVARSEGAAIGLVQAVANATETMARLHLKAGKALDAAGEAERAADQLTELGALPSAAAALEIAIRAHNMLGDEQEAAALRERADLAPQT